MAPVVARCEGCGVRIRIPNPEAALNKSCPRCATPLAAAIAKALSPESSPQANPLGINLEAPPEAPVAAKLEPKPKPSGVPLLVACVLVFAGSALSLGLWLGRNSAPADAKPSAPLALNDPSSSALTAGRPGQVADSRPGAGEDDAATPPREAETIEPKGAEDPASRPDPTPGPGTIETHSAEPLPERTLPTTELASRERIQPRFPPPSPLEPAPPAPEATAPPPPPVPVSAPPPAPAGERRVRIRTRGGETVVARVHGKADGKICVLLPNGELGFTSGTAETDEPFRPATMEEMEQELTGGGPFADYEVLRSDHYLVLYQSSKPFAEASIKLLESLYKNLSAAFKKKDFPVHDPELPLVAIIFRTEQEFRAHQQVDPDVQAYYEILSNRIYLYEKSERDQQSPEVAALRKPQTVAHEGTHQILQNIGIHPRLAPWPLWLVEGFAEYCSPPTMTRRGAAWGGLGLVNPMHMATIHDLDDPASLFVDGSERQRLGRDRRKPLVEYLITRSNLTPTDYALSWALTHYLAMKSPTEFLAFIQTMSQLPPLEERTPESHLAAFRAAFGPDLAKMDKKIAAHLAKLKYDPLPYYAVVFEQPVRGNQLRRATIVSQSPSMIRQWLGQVSDANGGESSWEAFPHPTRARAMLAAEQWIRSR